MSNKLPITSVTCALEVKNQEYGKGASRFISLRAEAPAGTEGLSLEEAIDQSLDMHLQAWQSVLGAQVGSSEMKTGEYSRVIKSMDARIEWVRNHLKEQTAAVAQES